MTTKDLFHDNKEQAKEALAIVTSATFERLLVYAKAEMATMSDVTSDQMKGVARFEKILKFLPEPEDKLSEEVNITLMHDVLAEAERKRQTKESK